MMYDRWCCMMDDAVWRMMMYDGWLHMMDDYVWSMIMYDRWVCVIDDYDGWSWWTIIHSKPNQTKQMGFPWGLRGVGHGAPTRGPKEFQAATHGVPEDTSYGAPWVGPRASPSPIIIHHHPSSSITHNHPPGLRRPRAGSGSPHRETCADWLELEAKAKPLSPKAKQSKTWTSFLFD